MQSISLSRRALLRSGAAAALAVPGAPLAALAQEAPAGHRDPWHGLKIGVASYSLRKLPVDAAVKAIQRVGLKYVSIKDSHLPMKSTAEQRKAVVQKFKDAGITPISCGVVGMSSEADIHQAFAYAKDIGVPVIVADPKPEMLPALDQIIKQHDIKIAIHNHGPEAKHFKSPYDTWTAIEKLDPRIGLCIDVGHTKRAGVDPAESIRKCKARLYDVHFKDIAKPSGGNTAMEVGRGILDVRGMLQALLDIGFQGHVGFEFEKAAENPLPGLAESVGYVRGVLSDMKPAQTAA
jgi:sugar phosphate isomerase/epimerase